MNDAVDVELLRRSLEGAPVGTPSPEALREYEAAWPGSAERVLRLAEMHEQFRQQEALRFARLIGAQQRMRHADLAFSLAMLAGWLGLLGYLVVKGFTESALLLAVIALVVPLLVTMVPEWLRDRRKRKAVPQGHDS